MGTAFFDMNETTLDLAPVRTLVDDLLPPPGGFTVWFQRLLQLSMTVTATGQPFVEFGTLARHAFDAMDASAPARFEVGAFDRVAEAMAGIQPYPEVAAALDRLRDAGWTTVALTNSGQSMVERQCDNAGLTDRFDHIISVEQVGIYKPAPEPYRHAVDVVGQGRRGDADTGNRWMVACHDWDLAGAANAGLRTAFVARPAMSRAAVYPDPDIIANNFDDLVEQLLALQPGG